VRDLGFSRTRRKKKRPRRRRRRRRRLWSVVDLVIGLYSSKKKGRKERGLRKDLNETKRIYGFSSSRHKNNRWILFDKLRFLFETTEERRGRETRRRDLRKRRLKEERRRRRRRRRVEGL
jgi:hypothetical protein